MTVTKEKLLDALKRRHDEFVNIGWTHTIVDNYPCIQYKHRYSGGVRLSASVWCKQLAQEPLSHLTKEDCNWVYQAIENMFRLEVGDDSSDSDDNHPRKSANFQWKGPDNNDVY